MAPWSRVRRHFLCGQEKHERVLDQSHLRPRPLRSVNPFDADRHDGGARRGNQGRPAGVQAAQVPLDRPGGGRSCLPRRRRSRRSAHLLRRHGGQRTVEVQRWRHPLEADFRRSVHLDDRFPGRRAVRSERPLRRLRRGQHPRQHRGRRRHLQVRRCRQDLETRLDAGRSNRHPDRSSGQPRHRLRGGARPRLRTQPGARHLSHHGRRQQLAARAYQGRRHRRLRRLLRSVQPEGVVRRSVAGTTAAVGIGQRRAGQRPVHVPRRRRHLDAACTAAGGRCAQRRRRGAERQEVCQGTSRRYLGQGWRGRGALRRPPRLRPHRGRQGRTISQR